MLQPWRGSNGIYNSLLHDKKTGFDTFLFERDVDGKKQVVVFRRRDIRWCSFWRRCPRSYYRY